MIEKDLKAQLKREGENIKPFFISAVAHQGIDKLKDAIMEKLDAE